MLSQVMGKWGVLLEGPKTIGNSVLGNYIGTDVSGTVALGNGMHGLSLSYQASGNVIGGSQPGAGNLIAGNANGGVAIGDTGTTLNTVKGNLIGTDVTGTQPLGNLFTGVVIAHGASENEVGGTEPGAGNVISNNGASGVVLDGLGVTGNVVAGNFIGTDISGTYSLPNYVAGVWISDGASDNTIGGTTPGARNLISGNYGYGIAVLTEEPDFFLHKTIASLGITSVAIEAGTSSLTIRFMVSTSPIRPGPSWVAVILAKGT